MTEPNPNEDVCDKHKKEDCMECFYTTQPIDPTPTPPPTGNYFQYRADPNEKKLEFDAPPTEWWEVEFEKTFVLQNYWKSDDDSTAFADIERVKSFIRQTITQALAEQKARSYQEGYEEGQKHAFGVDKERVRKEERARMVEVVGKHNALILNEYQNQQLGDERVLYPIITKATEQTMDFIKNTLNKENEN